MRIPSGHLDYSRWIVNDGGPHPQKPVDPPVRAVADVGLYDGSRELVEVHVVATAKGIVCVQQDVGGRGWFAWAPAKRVRRR